jgi:hypothetical protein
MKKLLIKNIKALLQVGEEIPAVLMSSFFMA